MELFYRRGRRIELTPIGKMLLTITEGLFGHEGEAIELLRAAKAREIGSLKIGAVRPPDAMEITSRLLKSHPNLQIVVTVGSGADILNALLNFDLDVGVIAYKPLDPRFFVSFYKRFRLHIVANASHSLAKRRSIRIEQLEGQQVIQRTTGVTRSVFNRALDKAGVKIRPVLETNSLEGVLAAIIEGIGLGVISDSGLTGVLGHHRLKVLPVTNADMFTDAYVVCLAERRERPLIASFLRCADEAPHKMSSGRKR